MAKRHNQTGSAVIVILLALIFLVVASFAGWFVWHAKSATTSTENTVSKNSTAVTPSAKVQPQSEPQDQSLDISEWAVHMTIPATFKTNANAQVVYAFGSDKNTILLGSDLQDSLPTSCAFSNKPGDGPWGITRYTEQTVDQDTKGALKHVGDYYYERFYPQTGCEESPTQVRALDNAYKQLYESITQD